MSGNGLTVVSLLDAQGNVVGYGAGSAAETSALAAQVWGAGPAPTSTPLVFLRDYMIARVKELRVLAEENGALISGNLWNTDIDSQVKYLGSLTFAVRDPSYSGRWFTKNNGYVTLDAAGLYSVCAGIMTYLQNCATYERDLTASIKAATTVAQLQAIDFTTGIPVGSLGVLPSVGSSTAPPLNSGSVTAQDIATSTLTTTGGVTVGGNLAVAGGATITGPITGALTGTATNVTATSNSTLTTLSALALPASQISGTVAIANGGTGATTAAAAITALTGTQTAGTYLRSDGTTTALSAIQAADVPTLNQNTTGTAANVTATTNSTITTLSALSLPSSQIVGTIPNSAASLTGTVAIANGGTGATTAAAAITALTGTQTAGTYLRSNGTTTALSAIQAADVPTLNQNTTGTAANVTATTNSTLTTLSALSLPIEQVSGLAAASITVLQLTATVLNVLLFRPEIISVADIFVSASTTTPTLDVTGTATVATLNVIGTATVATLDATTSTRSNRFLGGGATPTTTRLAGAGTTGVVTLGPGSTGSAGTLSIAAAGIITNAAGTNICTVTFPTPYAAAPFVTLYPSNAPAGNLARMPFVTTTATGFTLNQSGTVVMVASLTYTFNYLVIG